MDNQEEKEANAQSDVNSHPAVSQPGLSERDEDREGEAERKRELAEEEMAQAGQPQKLEEDLDQAHEEQMEEEEREEEQPDENALDRQRRQPQLVETSSQLLTINGLATFLLLKVIDFRND